MADCSSFTVAQISSSSALFAWRTDTADTTRCQLSRRGLKSRWGEILPFHTYNVHNFKSLNLLHRGSFPEVSIVISRRTYACARVTSHFVVRHEWKSKHYLLREEFTGRRWTHLFGEIYQAWACITTKLTTTVCVCYKNKKKLRLVKYRLVQYGNKCCCCCCFKKKEMRKKEKKARFILSPVWPVWHCKVMINYTNPVLGVWTDYDFIG